MNNETEESNITQVLHAPEFPVPEPVDPSVNIDDLNDNQAIDKKGNVINLSE